MVLSYVTRKNLRNKDDGETHPQPHNYTAQLPPKLLFLYQNYLPKVEERAHMTRTTRNNRMPYQYLDFLTQLHQSDLLRLLN